MHHPPAHACDRSDCSVHEAASPSHKIQVLWLALLLIGSLSLTELLVGFWSHSLALLADSGHMLSDVLALGLALVAAWMAQRSPKPASGLQKFELLAALVNSLGLVAIALWIAWEAVSRLQTPTEEILSLPMLITAVLGLGINTLSASLLHQDSHSDLNLRGAFLHMVADAISSIGVLLAAIAIGLFGWFWADGAISLLVAGLIILSSLPLVWQSCNRLLATPQSVGDS